MADAERIYAGNACRTLGIIMDVDQNAPMKLADIIPIAFPHGGMTPSGLRREASRGRLTIMRMAGKDFTTLAYIEEMKRKCRVTANPQDSGYGHQARTERPSGSSLMTGSNTALVAAREIAERLKGSYPGTSPIGTSKSRKASTAQHQK